MRLKLDCRIWIKHQQQEHEQYASEFSNISQMALLPGGPRRPGTKQGVPQRLVVHEVGKLTSFQEETEVTH